MAKRLVIKVGEYDKEGATKGEYMRLGVIISSDSGEYLLLDPCVNLAGALTKQNILNHKNGKPVRDMVMCSIFTDEHQQQAKPVSPTPQQPVDDDFDDRIPF